MDLVYWKYIQDPVTHTGEYFFEAFLEVVLLCEEMHQYIMYCHWKAPWWIEQQYSQAMNLPQDGPICKGLEVYSRQQALHELKLTDAWEKHWLPV